MRWEKSQTTFTTDVITPELDVVITGTTSGFTGMEYLLTAQVSPITTTLPLTYVWTIGDIPADHAYRRAE